LSKKLNEQQWEKNKKHVLPGGLPRGDLGGGDLSTRTLEIKPVDSRKGSPEKKIVLGLSRDPGQRSHRKVRIRKKYFENRQKSGRPDPHWGGAAKSYHSNGPGDRSLGGLQICLSLIGNREKTSRRLELKREGGKKKTSRSLGNPIGKNEEYTKNKVIPRFPTNTTLKSRLETLKEE